MTLRISPDLALPVDFVTKTCAILAQRRKGKTYTAAVLAEELVAAELPWVALDPTGAWWGLRASADGESEGLPVVILGGQHGDAPLERSAGKFVAELVVESPGWYVLDMSLFESRAAEREFAADLGEALIRRKRQPGRDFPMHLFVDEADMFAPQERETGDQRMLGAYQAIVRRGGLHGLGSTLISQRPALLNKSVLTQLDILILLRLVAGQDQDAVDKSYLSRAGSRESRAEVMDSLASLSLGEAWVWEPGAEPPLYDRVRIRERRTFNSSATPKPGEARVEPRRLADVDLDAVKDAMGAAIERAKADDPRELRRRIAELERELRTAQAATPETEIVVERVEVPYPVEVPVIDEPMMARFKRLYDLHDEVSRLRIDIATLIEKVKDCDRQDVPAQGRAGGGARALERSAVPAQRLDPPQRREPRRAAVLGAEAAEGPTGVVVDRIHHSDGSGPDRQVKLGKGERKVLAVLATYPEGRTYDQLAFLAGYSAKASTLGVILSKLRKAGLVTPGGGDAIALTDEGVAEAGDVEPLPSGPELLDHWRRHPRMGAGERTVLDTLVESWPEALSHDELCERTGYSPSASTIGVILSKLRKLGLVEKGARRLTDEFMEAVR